MSLKPKIFNLSTLLTTPTPHWVHIVRDPLKRQLKNELKVLNLKAVKRLHFQFDPFHRNVSSIREFLCALSDPKKRATNPKCGLKTDILSKREEPTLTLTLESGQKVIFKTSLLSTLEITENFNKILNNLSQTPETLVRN